MKVVSRETFGKVLFDIYMGIGTNPDANGDMIEGILKEFGFAIGNGTAVTRYRPVLIDKDEDIP